MKELTIEQKAKAYDEAKARMSRAWNENRCTLGFRNEIFPELAESEDEKIRKELITHCRNTRCVTEEGAERIAKWIAWLENIPYTIDHEKREGFHLGYKAGLEKQGREKPQRMISAEAKEAMYDKPAWNERDEKEYKYVLKFVDNILNNCGNKKDYEHCKRCYDWLKSLKQKIGSKQ